MACACRPFLVHLVLIVATDDASLQVGSTLLAAGITPLGKKPAAGEVYCRVQDRIGEPCLGPSYQMLLGTITMMAKTLLRTRMALTNTPAETIFQVQKTVEKKVSKNLDRDLGNLDHARWF